MQRSKIVSANSKIMTNYICFLNGFAVREEAYFPHSGGGFHADRSMSDLALGRQFLTTKYFVVN